MRDDIPEALRHTSGVKLENTEQKASSETSRSYHIVGDFTQKIELELKPTMSVIGAITTLVYYEPDIDIKVRMLEGDTRKKGILSRIFGFGKQVLTGHRLFMTTFTNRSTEIRKIAFAAVYPGKIIPVKLKEHHGKIYCQKEAFLCASKATLVGTASQHELGGGFSNTGVVMQKIEGEGVVFLQGGGHVTKRKLEPGEIIYVSVDSTVAMQSGVTIHVKRLRNVGAMGEGHNIIELQGPGTVWLQSVPFSMMRQNVTAHTIKTLGIEPKKKGQALKQPVQS